MNIPRLTIIAVAVLLCTAVYASDEAPDKTAGALNGRFWQTCNSAVKTGFVVGFDSAIRAVAKITKDEAEKYSGAVSYGEMEKAIDRIYERPENLSLPILVAIRIAALRFKGVPDEKIGDVLASDGVWRSVAPKQ